jgi:hypothetical protein
MQTLWICSSCNVAIGHLKDDPEMIRKAAAYLEACAASVT